jgi:hypothetical protein
MYRRLRDHQGKGKTMVSDIILVVAFVCVGVLLGLIVELKNVL